MREPPQLRTPGEVPSDVTHLASDFWNSCHLIPNEISPPLSRNSVPPDTRRGPDGCLQRASAARRHRSRLVRVPHTEAEKRDARDSRVSQTADDARQEALSAHIDDFMSAVRLHTSKERGVPSLRNV